jgi:hypothetical protein
VGSPAAVVAQLGVLLRRELGCDARAVEAAADALADRPTCAGQQAQRRCRSCDRAGASSSAPSSSRLDDVRRCVAGFSLVILNGVAWPCGSAVALPQTSRGSELKPGAGVHHRCFAAVDGADDLLGGDPFEVGAGGREVCVPELALDQRQRDPLVQQLDGVRMPQLERWNGNP